ncbi:MAG: methionine adenosyltransferase [Pyrinomonadaceae bacterium]
MNYKYTFTSESVSEGHPDKVCDLIADSILDAHLEHDPNARVACEVLCKKETVVVAGEITASGAECIDHERIVRDTIRQIGYTEPSEPFHADSVKIIRMISEQADEIAQGIDEGRGLFEEQGAGDQGIMFGYATSETPELMPLPILLAHRLAQALAQDRRSERIAGLRPDAKTQVSVVYEQNRPVGVSDILVSTQHRPEIAREQIYQYVVDDLAPRVLGDWFTRAVRVHVNPTGSFVHGGPSADCGVTGRKIIVDTYGGMGRHGGGAFSGKDPSKVDRSGAYFCRFVARQIVKAGLAEIAEVQVAYAIGVAQPISVKVDTFGTGDSRAAEAFVAEGFDFRPSAIIDRLDLRRPLYRTTTNYGHFGRAGFAWER